MVDADDIILLADSLFVEVFISVVVVEFLGQEMVTLNELSTHDDKNTLHLLALTIETFVRSFLNFFLIAILLSQFACKFLTKNISEHNVLLNALSDG